MPAFSPPLRAAGLLLAWAAVAGCDVLAEATAPVQYVRQYESTFATDAPRGCLADGAALGAWSVRFAGHGCVRPGTDGERGWLLLAPGAVRGAGRTKAALVVGPSHGDAFRLSLALVSDAHLRTGAAPNPWEAAWVVWDYTDDAHFSYAVLKPNGWEVGKRDPAYPGGQRFLSTGATPAFPIGRWYDVTVERADGATTLHVDGTSLTTFTDRERPYRGGQIGLYTEDAAVRFAGIRLEAAAR